MNQRLSRFSSLLMCVVLLFSASCARKKPSAVTEATQAPVITLTGEEIASAKKVKDMSFEEAARVLAYYKTVDKEPQMASVYERLVGLAADHETMEPLLREFADLKFKLQDFEEAEALYQQYVMLYPGGKDIDYMESRIIDSMQRQLLDGQRDQTKVKALIQRAGIFIERFGEKSKFTPAVVRLLRQGQFSLFESEINRVAFYIQKYLYTERPASLQSARARLLRAVEKQLPELELSIAKDKKALMDKAIERVKDENFAKEPVEKQFEYLQRAVDLLLLAIEESKPKTQDGRLTKAFKRIF